MKIFKTLCISSIHLPPGTLEYYEWPAYDDGCISMIVDCGTHAMFGVYPTCDAVWSETTPAWLKIMCDLARAHECEFILFQSSDEVTEGLPIYEKSDEKSDDSLDGFDDD